MNNLPLILLFIFSVFTMNLTLQCALGIKAIATIKNESWLEAAKKLSIIFISILLLWFTFSKIIFSFFSGIFIYILVFPVSYIVFYGLDFLVSVYLIKKNTQDESFIGFPEGITGVAAFICINIADSFPEALVLSFGFAAGVMIAVVIAKEVGKRASFETVPVFLRGKPLILITMGMLSLIFSTASFLLSRMMNVW